MFISRLIIGSICIFLGLIIIKYRKKIHDFTGVVGFAERIFGSGGTYTLYAIVGALLVIGSILYIFGLTDGLISNIFRPLFPGL